MKLWLETLPLHTFDVRTNDSSDDELSDIDEDTPLMDGLIALNRAAEIVERSGQSVNSVNNLDTLAKAATQALNGNETSVEDNLVNKTKLIHNNLSDIENQNEFGKT